MRTLPDFGMNLQGRVLSLGCEWKHERQEGKKGGLFAFFDRVGKISAIYDLFSVLCFHFRPREIISI
jgi:hypothetical protein